MGYKEFVSPKVTEEKIKGNNVIVISPEYSSKGSDIMKKAGKFYAVYNSRTGMWSLDQALLDDLIDEKLYLKRKEIATKGNDDVYRTKNGLSVMVSDIEHSSSHKLGELNKWLYDLAPNKNYHQLDSDLTFLSDETTITDYRSKRLKYDIKHGDVSAYNKLMSTLYLPEEREKLEWAIGSILAGDSKNIDKMVILYGKPGTGKSTVLWIIRLLFEGYCTTFTAAQLADRQYQFATAAFKDNPLVAIQDDGSLSKINDPRINTIISHESLLINEKGKPEYEIRPNAMLFLATNEKVDIRDTNLGITRRFIDVYPTGEKIPFSEYSVLKNQIKHEIASIAGYCLNVYKEVGMDKYIDYRPEKMIHMSNPMINFIFECYNEVVRPEYITLKDAYALFKQFYEDSGYGYPPKKLDFKEEFKQYFKYFDEETVINNKKVFCVYREFKTDKLSYSGTKVKKDKSTPQWLAFKECPSLFTIAHKDDKAQYDSGDELYPLRMSWDKCGVKLNDLDDSKLHWVLMQGNEIVIDIDYHHEDPENGPVRNLEEAKNWPETYAELSKSGGIHLHYIYDGDVNELANRINSHVEVKTFPRDKHASLRRKLTKCNDRPIATIDGVNLPKKERKEETVLNEESYKTEKQLKLFIKDCLEKKHHGHVAPEVNFIKSELDKTYNSGIHYDVSDLRQEVLSFAASSTNQSAKCMKLVSLMHFYSDDVGENSEDDENKPIIFFDCEVFPNLFILNWKYEGEDKQVVRMINPTPSEVENLVHSYRLIGFNNRRYDNHILYARMQGYSLEGLYSVSQQIINGEKGSRNGFFGSAYNLSYTDIYDFANMDNKMSLKKWEIKLKIHHQELDLPWDQPVPEDMWIKVAEYCDNDVIATEAVFYACHGDWVAREILADISGLTVNDTTNSHTEKIIFGNAKNPQVEFNYVDLSTEFPGYSYDATRTPKSLYLGEDPGEGGYVYAEPGIYHNVALLDVASMHPTSLECMNLFGPYTRNFSDLKKVRVLIKHKDYEAASQMFDGKLAKYLTNKDDAKALSNALKIAINSVYGLTSASFNNKCRDPRNIDNIVAKRGALFMINLKNEVQRKGYTVVHIKTDSIKIADADDKIIDFVMNYGQKYGYTFEHEATYSRICLVNNAVYIAQYAGDEEHEEELSTGEKIKTNWTATGAEFQHPYIFKTLFSHTPVNFYDYCETKTVAKGSMYLDLNESLEKDEHNYQFIGRAGSFVPIKPGCNGGELLVLRDTGKYSAVTGTKGYRWMEREDVLTLHKEDTINMTYFQKLADDAVNHIAEFGNVDEFTQIMNKPE